MIASTLNLDLDLMLMELQNNHHINAWKYFRVDTHDVDWIMNVVREIRKFGHDVKHIHMGLDVYEDFCAAMEANGDSPLLLGIPVYKNASLGRTEVFVSNSEVLDE